MSLSRAQASRLQIRSWRRGTKEMDLLLGGVANQLLRDGDEAGCRALESLLELADPQVSDMVYGLEDPGEHTVIVQRIRAHHGLDQKGRAAK